MAALRSPTRGRATSNEARGTDASFPFEGSIPGALFSWTHLQTKASTTAPANPSLVRRIPLSPLKA